MDKNKMALYLDALLDFGKETLRLIVTALVSYLLTDGVINTIVGWLFGTRLSPEMVVIMTGAFTTVIKSLDRALHNVGVTVGDESLTKSILRF